MLVRLVMFLLRFLGWVWIGEVVVSDERSDWRDGLELEAYLYMEGFCGCDFGQWIPSLSFFLIVYMRINIYQSLIIASNGFLSFVFQQHLESDLTPSAEDRY